MTKYICKYCGKKFIKYRVHNYKYCSHKCSIEGAQEYMKKNQKGIYGLSDNQRRQMGKKGAETNRKNKTSCFFDKKLQSILGKRAAEKHRKNGTGCCFDPKWLGVGGKIGGKRAAITNRKNGTSLFDPKIQAHGAKLGNEACRKRKIGMFDPTKWIQRKGVTLGLKAIREKYCDFHPKFKGIIFDSQREVEVCKNLMTKYSSFHPIQNVTVHKTVGMKEFDFLVRNTFIDYHVFSIGKTLVEYYRERRKVLDDNGHRNFNYIVVSGIGKMDNLTLRKEGII